MASPLILKIQTLLDSKGFKDFERSVDKAKASLTGLGQAAATTGVIFQNLGTIIGTAISADQLRRLGRLAIELEASTAQLASFLALTSNDADRAAERFRNLASEVSRATGFMTSDLLVAQRELAKGTQSFTRIQDQLNLSLLLAASSGISAAQAAIALRRAEAGSLITLRELTGVRVETLQQLREQGRLTEGLAQIFGRSGALERRLDTVAGQFSRLSARIRNTQDVLGRTFLLPPLRALANFLDGLPDPLIDFGVITATLGPLALALGALFPPLGIVLAGLKGFAAIELDIQRKTNRVNEELRQQLELLQAQGTSAGQTVAKLATQFGSLNRVQDLLITRLQGLREQERLLVSAIKEREEIAENSAGLAQEEAQIRATTSRRGLRTVQAEINATEDLNKLILEGQRLRREQGILDSRELQREFDALTLSRSDSEQRLLEEQLNNSRILLLTSEGDSNERILLASQAINRLIALERLLQSTQIGFIEEEINARRRLQALRESLIRPLEEDATVEERGRRRDLLVRTFNQRAAAIRAEESLRLRAIATRFDAEERNIQRQFQGAENQVEREEALTELAQERARESANLEAEIVALRLDSNRAFSDELEFLGEIAGRRDEAQIATNRILSLERELTRVVKEREQLGFAEPRDEELLRQTTDAVGRAFEQLATLDFNLTLNFDRTTLVQTVIDTLNEQLKFAGFLIQQAETAGTEPDEAPSPSSNPALLIARLRGIPLES